MDHLNTGAQDEFGNDISADIYLVRCARCNKRIGTYIVPGLKDDGVDGDLISEYRGTFDIDYSDERILFDDENGNRHVIYFKTGTIIVDEVN